jgi:hypothetical protein
MPRMPNHLHIAIAVFIIALLASCAMEGPCEGTLVLTNPISDVTVAVGDTVYIDLSNPPVFVSSKGRVSYFPEVLTGLSNVDVHYKANPNDQGNFTLLLVIGEAKGNASAKLSAVSNCLENSTTFNITVQ